MIIKELNTEIYKLRLHVLTPLYIGSGDSFDLASFWIDSQKCELVQTSPDAFVPLLNEQEIESLGDMSFRNLAALLCSKKPAGIRKKVSPYLAEKYFAYLNNVFTDRNQFEIKKTAFSPVDNMPYIPGSSLKGTLRTGYIASKKPVLSEKYDKKGNKKEYIDEDGLLGGIFSKSPFAALKVSDFVFSSKDDKIPVSIVFADRVSKKLVKGQYKHLPVTMLEIIDPGTVFEGSISLHKNNGTIQKPIENIETLLQNINDYSESLLADEEIGIKFPLMEHISAIRHGFGGRKTYLCRLGGYIGAESHTIPDCRKIKIRNPFDKHDIRDYSTMTVYASPEQKKTDKCNITLGWCILEIADSNEMHENKALADFSASQLKMLFAMPVGIKKQSGIGINQSLLQPQKMSFDRNGVYDAEVVELSKKGKPIAKSHGSKFTVMNAADLKIGDKIKITGINGTTCKIKER
ncbi:MAG: type III-A CRISPR-associated RAMP protein Csm5 [Elusimicrobiales bacterium]|nr:type III-A CRISPR-associated RAMP protein Csm5 [Elusimicrobiales bacterium]